MSNLIRFPTTTYQRIKNKRGKRSVSCIVSERYLRFTDHWTRLDEGTAIFVDIMTVTDDGDRKLCSLCITMEELMKAAGNVAEMMDKPPKK